MPRTRQDRVAAGRSVAGYTEDDTISSRTSGAVNELWSSIWISYVVAPGTSAQSNVTGCGGASPFDGASSAGAAGTGGGAGGVEVVRARSTRVTKASPQKMDGSPLNTVSNARVVAGKPCEYVTPMTSGSPSGARATSTPLSACGPPRNVEYVMAEPAGESCVRNASETPLKPASAASAEVG